MQSAVISIKTDIKGIFFYLPLTQSMNTILQSSTTYWLDTFLNNHVSWHTNKKSNQ